MATLLSMLYDIVVMPLVYIVDLAFSLFCRLLQDPGLALVGVSLVVNFLCLPLYRMADRMQDEERARQAKMADRVAQIKRSFKGDEQYMMLSTYYRQQGYKPIYALNGSVSLLLQIPVFMAAYSYLSSATALQGASFLFLNDLGAPDQLIKLGGLTLNLMPLLMTLFNCVSTFVYTRDLPLRDKLQAYGLALVFLVLLYQSPSGLVFYWTCNQVFSLVKNLFLKVLKRPQFVFGILVQVALVWAWGYLIGSDAITTFGGGLLVTLGFVLVDWPILASLFGWKPRHSLHPDGGTTPVVTFLLAALLLFVLLGVLVPSALIGSSPKEFVSANGYDDQLQFVLHTGCVFFGLFVLWVGTYLYLSDEAGRRTISFGLSLLAVVSLVGYFFFGQGFGILGADLVYEYRPVFDLASIMLNLGVVAAVCVVFSVLWKRGQQLVNPLLAIMCAGLVFLAVPNVRAVVTLTDAASSTVQVGSQKGSDASGQDDVAQDQAAQNEDEPAVVVEPTLDGGSSQEESAPDWVLEGEGDYASDEQPTEETPQADAGFWHQATTEVPFDEEGNPQPIVNLSRDGRNVVVVFLDRGISGYLPYLMKEKPEIASMYDGFTYYPNTLSFGLKTVFGSPGLYGGYEYVPYISDERFEEYLVDKQGEALRVLPTLFSQAGFDVTMFDPALVGYNYYTDDYSLFDGIPNVSVYHTAGAYTRWYSTVLAAKQSGEGADFDLDQALAENAQRFKRNLCWYAIFRTVPTFAQQAIYDGGSYLAAPDAIEVERQQPVIAPTAVATAESRGITLLSQRMAGVSVTSLFVTEYVAPEAEPEVPVEMTEEEAAAAAAAAEAAQAQADAAFQEQLLTGYVGRRSINNEFLSWYSVLAAMPTITSVQDGAQDHFVFIDNQTTHTPELLQMPDYVPSLYIDNTQYLDTSVFTIDGRTINMNNDFHYRHYMSNMAAILRLGEWFDYLREQGCWDNTRVIIVSDHGHTLGQFPWMRVDDSFNAESVNPIFMVKDFGQTGFETSYEFMTNADTPTLALRDIVYDPINPFTGQPINNQVKYDGDVLVNSSQQWRTAEQTGTTFSYEGGHWYSVHDNIFDPNCWTLLD